jgi:hypothetical protein
VAEAEHTVERRARLLAEKMQTRVRVLSNFLAPPGQRAPFTKQLSDAQALRFWRAHRYDPLGAEVLQSMRPQDIAELDMALMSHSEEGAIE